MVDSINGPGKKIIITTKPKPKAKTDGNESFDKALKSKSGSANNVNLRSPALAGPAQHNIKLIQQQQLMRMQHIQEITQQVKDGTYKMVDPAVLAEKIFQVITDKSTREKFIKKLIQEETENKSLAGDSNLSELELKKLVFLIKESQDEPFDDPQLEQMLAEFS